MPHASSDSILVAGAGIIGLSTALALRQRGYTVTVVDTRRALQGASIAAAGMLAEKDPHHPPALRELAAYSASLYPAYLSNISALSSELVPFQTDTTVQYGEHGESSRIDEHSIDPRQLAPALLAAVRAAGIAVHENVAAFDVSESGDIFTLTTSGGIKFHAQHIVHTSGSWTQAVAGVSPLKGQMLRVKLPADLPLTEVHRRAGIYIVPRTLGPQAGTALIGATEEHAGFDTTTHETDLARLRTLAAVFFPLLADSAQAPVLESWAGLRPATVDRLPVLGRLSSSSQQIVAAGHHRNGILLAPATAKLVADIIDRRKPTVDIENFRPQRLA